MRHVEAGSKRTAYLVLCTCVAAGLLGCPALVRNAIAAESSEPQARQYHPHCGLYCVYAALRLADRKLDFRELVKRDYIKSNKGSTLVELRRAAEDHGLYATLATKMTERVLRECRHPVILHVKPSLTSPTYSHYELYLGAKEGKARILNPPGNVALVPFSELAPRWDGNGLILSDRPIDIGAVFAPAREHVATAAIVATVFVLLVRAANRARLRLYGPISGRLLLIFSVAQTVALGVIVLLGGMIYHYATEAGLLANTDAVKAIQSVHAGNFIPKLSLQRVSRLVNTDTVFIDARVARDFATGHLDGAISLPVNTGKERRDRTLAGVSKAAPVVVYCQSSACKFAESVAVTLATDGFSNVSIFKGGWAEWEAHHSRPARQADVAEVAG